MTFKICAALVLVCLLGVCLAANKPITDNYIIDEVRIKLSGDIEVKGGALMVECKDGIVTITGAVENQHLKDKASKLAKKVKGVKQVNNNIEIKKRG